MPYQQLQDNDNEDTKPSLHVEPRRSKLPVETGLTLLGGVALLAALTYLLATQHLPLTPQHPCICGNSSTEAAARGCEFDLFTLAWLPKACRDETLTAAFQEAGRAQGSNWTFATYPDRAQTLTLDEVARLAGPRGVAPGMVMTTIDWHHTHCFYVSLMVARAGLGAEGAAVRVPPRYESERHLEHCASSVLRWVRQMSPAEMMGAASEVDVYVW